MDIFDRYPIIVLKKLNIKMTDGYISLSKDHNTSNSGSSEMVTLKNKKDLFPESFEIKGDVPSSLDHSMEISEGLVNKVFAQSKNDETNEIKQKTALSPSLLEASVNNYLGNGVEIKKVKSKPIKWYCAKCSLRIKRSHYSIKCNKCNDWLHLRCSNLDSIKEWHGAWSGSCCGVESDKLREDLFFLDFPQDSEALCLPDCKISPKINLGVTGKLASFCPKYLQEKRSEIVYDDKLLLTAIKCKKKGKTGGDAESLINNLSSPCDIESKSKEFTTEFSNVSQLASKTIYNEKPVRPVPVLEDLSPEISNSERHTNSKSCKGIYCVTKHRKKSEPIKWYCAKCSLQIKRSHYSVKCNKCNDWLHLRCSNLDSIKEWHGEWSGSCCGVESDKPRENLFFLDFPQHGKAKQTNADCKISPKISSGMSGELVSFFPKYLPKKPNENVHDDKSLLTAIKCKKKGKTGEDAESLMNNLSSPCDIESKSKEFTTEFSSVSQLTSKTIYDKKPEPVLEDLFPKNSHSGRHTNSKSCVVPVKSKPAASDSEMLVRSDLRVKSYLKQHVKSQFEGSPFACGHCPMTFKHKAFLSQHIKMHTGDKLVQRKLCPEKFRQQPHLKSHILLQTNDKSFVFPNCSAKFQHKESLQLHLESKNSTNQPHPCPLCPEKFMRKSEFENHMMRHFNQRLTCAHCYTKVVSKSGFLGHKSRSHSYEELYSCEHCDKKFNGKTDVRSHMKAVHSKQNGPQSILSSE